MKKQLIAIGFGLASAAMALAAAPKAGADSGNVLPGGDSRDPISIEAEKLIFSQREQKAIYSGSVVAIQGPTTIKCSTMVLLLDNSNAHPAATPDANASSSSGASQVKRMDCAGPVAVFSKTQAATGDSAIYIKADNSFTILCNATYSEGGNVTKGDKINYDLDTGRAVVESGGCNVKTRVRSEFAPGQSSPKDANDGVNVLPGGNSRDPVSIEAEKLVFTQKEQKATYGGSVVAIQGPTTIKCSTMVLLLESQNAHTAHPAATSNTNGSSSSDNSQVKRMDCAGPVTVLSKTQVATGDSAVYVKADNAFTLIGAVTYSEGGNVTKGDKINYDLNTGRAVVESAGANGKSRVHSEFMPGQSAPKDAKDSGNVLPGGNSKDPVEIEAEKLDFSQKEQKAIYGGSVIASQGPTTIKCSTMVLLLESANSRAPHPAATPDANASSSSGNSQVKRMDCAGPVTVFSKTQVATGDSAVYIKADNTFTLIGAVTYSEGGNATKGDKIHYDLNTGKATVESDGGNGKTRVRSEFIPGQANEK